MLFVVALSLAAPLCVEGGHGCRDTVHGWTVARLRGTDAEAGAQYAALMGAELRLRYVPMMDKMWGELPGVLRGVLRGRDRRSREMFDSATTAKMEALEGALGLPRGRYRDYAWVSELSSVGPSLMVALGGTLQLDDVRAAAYGARCTSVVGTTPEGTLHARNLDFPGMDYWQPNQSLLFVEPRRADGTADGFRYAHAGTLGEVFAGTTAVNEPGLVVTVHVHASRDTALLDGRVRMGVFDLLSAPARGGGEWGAYRLVETLARRFPTVAAALDGIAAVRTLGAWSVVLSDPSGDSAVVDVNLRDQVVHRGERAATNEYADPTMRLRELVPSAGPFLGARHRLAQARAGLAAAGAELDVDEAIGVLRSQVDGATGVARPASANSVLSIDTSQSLAIESRRDGDHRLWVAEPQPDARSPAALAGWVELRFRDGFALGADAPFPHGDQRAAATLPADTARWAQAHQLMVDAHAPAEALAVLDLVDDDGARLVGAWLAASMDDDPGASRRLASVERARLSAHHRALAGWLEGELALRGGAPADAARRAWTDARDALAADARAHPERADLYRLLDAVLARRSARALPVRRLPAPDLKFQDVLSLPRR